MNPRLRFNRGAGGGYVPPPTGFTQSITFDNNYTLSAGSMASLGDVNFTMDGTGAITGKQTTVTIKADGAHDLVVSTATLTGAGFDNTRNRLQTFTFIKTSGGYTYSVTPGAIEDLDGPVLVYAHIEDDDRSLVLLEFDEELKNYASVGTSKDMPASSSFSIPGLTITDCYIGAYGSQLALRLSAEVNGGETHTVSFGNPVTNKLTDYSNNPAPNFAGISIVDNVVTRRTALYDDFSLKANGSVGLPITGPGPTEHDPYGGASAIISGKFTNQPGTGNGCSTTWDVGVNDYELTTQGGGSGTGYTYFRYVDENNHYKLSQDLYHLNLRCVIAGADNSVGTINTSGVAAGATGLTALPMKVKVTPTQMLMYDYSGALVFTLATTQFATSTKVGFRFAGNGYNIDFIKVRTPS